MTTKPTNCYIESMIADRINYRLDNLPGEVSRDIADTIRQDVDASITYGLGMLDVQRIIRESAAATVAAGNIAGLDYNAEFASLTNEIGRRLREAIQDIVSHAIDYGINEGATAEGADQFLSQHYDMDDLAVLAVDEVHPNC